MSCKAILKNYLFYFRHVQQDILPKAVPIKKTFNYKSSPCNDFVCIEFHKSSHTKKPKSYLFFKDKVWNYSFYFHLPVPLFMSKYTSTADRKLMVV